MDLSLYSCHRPECHEEMLLCCILLFLHSDITIVHTRVLMVSEWEIILGENSILEKRLFRRRIRYTLFRLTIKHNFDQFP